jgi:hypothetical protein
MWLTFDINAIANSMDTFMNFNISDLKFINSCRVMASSLETLANNLIWKIHLNIVSIAIMCWSSLIHKS